MDFVTVEKIKLNSIWGGYFLWRDLEACLEKPQTYPLKSEYSVVGLA